MTFLISPESCQPMYLTLNAWIGRRDPISVSRGTKAAGVSELGFPFDRVAEQVAGIMAVTKGHFLSVDYRFSSQWFSIDEEIPGFCQSTDSRHIGSLFQF